MNMKNKYPINKNILNTSELFSIIINKANEDKNDFNLLKI